MNDNQPEFSPQGYTNTPADETKPEIQSSPQQNIPTNETKKDIKALISIIIGAIAIIITIIGFLLRNVPSIVFIISLLAGLILSITGLILSILSKNKIKTLGIILNIIAILITIIFFILGLTLGRTFNIVNLFDDVKHDIEIISTEMTYSGGEFELTYDSPNWVIAKTHDGIEALKYKDGLIILTSIGHSALSDSEHTLNCTFDSDNCKEAIYNSFYKKWYTDDKDDISLSNNSNFKILKNDIYYATMDYTSYISDAKGKMYLIISEEKNIILSFMSATSKETNTNDTEVLKILKTIEISDKYANIEYIGEDNRLPGILESMSNWNRYINLRKGSLGRKVNLDGGWRALSDQETYWIFRNDSFYWYKSVDDLNDNYWYGTTKIYTGKEGLAIAGLNEEAVDKITTQSEGTITPDNIYTIIMTPSKLFADGIDQSSSITEGASMTQIWILVDHGTEGIEAQVLNPETADTGYFVKLSD